METHKEFIEILGEVIAIEDSEYSNVRDSRVVLSQRNPNKPRIDNSTFFGILPVDVQKTIIIPFEIVNEISGPVVYADCILCEEKDHCKSVPIVRQSQYGRKYYPEGSSICSNCINQIERWMNSIMSLVEDNSEDITSQLL